MGAEVFWSQLFPSVCSSDEMVYRKTKYCLDQRRWFAFAFLTARLPFCAGVDAAQGLQLRSLAAQLRGFGGPAGVTRCLPSQDSEVSFCVWTAVGAGGACGPVAASCDGDRGFPANQGPPRALNVFVFIYWCHGGLESKANLICCIAANFVCIRDALNILISWVPVGKPGVAH